MYGSEGEMKPCLQILLIDDDNDDAEMIMYALRKLSPIEIKYIDDGAEALHFLLNATLNEPALILLDLKMPRVDGIEILRALKNSSDRRHIPVAALISSNSGVNYVESFGIRPDAYLHKPVSTNDFLRVLPLVGLAGVQSQLTGLSVNQ